MITASIQQRSAMVATPPALNVPAKGFAAGAIHGGDRSPHCRAVMKLLLESMERVPAQCDDAGSIWIAEANHRIQLLLELFLTLRHACSKQHRVTNIWNAPYDVARKLADTYRMLEHHDPLQLLPCEQTIRVLVSGLAGLFRAGPRAPEIEIQIHSLYLLAEKRRALALLISALMLGTLLYGAQRGSASRLRLSAAVQANQKWAIKLATNLPLSCSFESPGYQIICALSGILEADISYSEAPGGGTQVALLMPF